MMQLRTMHRIQHGEQTYRAPITLPLRNGIPVLEPTAEVPAKFKFVHEQLTKAHFKPITFEEKRAVYARRVSSPHHFTDHLFTLDLDPERGGPRWILESRNEVLFESGRRSDWKALGIHDLRDLHDMRFFIAYFGGMR
jgi:hypothetical protein